MSNFPSAHGFGVGSDSINVPDSHRFQDASARDAAITSPHEGEQCTVESNTPQYHLLQEYRSGDWVDITYLITGPKGDIGPRGHDGSFIFESLDSSVYGNLFAPEWGLKETGIYGVDGLGGEFSNTPYPFNASTTYNTEVLLVNEPNQYSMRLTVFANAGKSGRESVIGGVNKTGAESANWETIAFTSDTGHADPSEGFNLNDGADIGLSNSSALTIKNNNGDAHNVVDQDENLDAIRLGSPAMETYLRTGTSRMQVQTTDGMKEIAFTGDIPSHLDSNNRFAYWVREDVFNLTEEHIQKEILLMCQPFTTEGNAKVNKIVFPSQSVFTKHYYIPDVNESEKETLPHISNFKFSIWLFHYSTEGSDIKLEMTSEGNWLPFVSSKSLSENNGVYLFRREGDLAQQDLHTFAFMRPISFNPAVGVQGWSLQNVYPERWVPIGDEPPPPFSPTVPELKYFDLGTDYHDLNAPEWATVIADNAPEQDIIYTRMVGIGSSFSNLPSGITLTGGVEYVIATETSRGPDAGFAQRVSILSLTPDDPANNRTAQRTGVTLDKSEWAVASLKRDSVVYKESASPAPGAPFTSIVTGENLEGELDAEGNLTLSTKQSLIHDTVRARVLEVHEGADNPEKFIQLFVDGNFNTTFHSVGDTHYYTKDKETGSLTEAFQIDSSGRVIIKQKVKTPQVTTPASGTTNSNSDKAAFIDFSTDNQVKIGAKSLVKFNINGQQSLSVDDEGINFTGLGSNAKIKHAQDIEVISSSTGNVSFTPNGMQILHNVNGGGFDYSNSGNFSLASGKHIRGHEVGDLVVDNLGSIRRNSAHDKNSVTLNNADIIYKSDSHHFKDGDGNDLFSFNKTEFSAYNRNFKHLRHLVGNSVGSMFVANVGLIKRNDSDNSQNSISLDDGVINAYTDSFDIVSNAGAIQYSFGFENANFHDKQLKGIADGVDASDAATVGQINALGGIPYLRKFDSTGGDIYAHSYPEGRVQSWINYKGDGASDLRIDSMRNGSDQQFDMVAVDNQSVNICKLRLFFNGSSVLLRVMPGEVVQCWASRSFTRWKWQFGTESSPTGNFQAALDEYDTEKQNDALYEGIAFGKLYIKELQVG